MGSERREPPERHRATLATESVASKSERSAREGAEESISSWRRARTSKSACGSLMVVKVGRRVVLFAALQPLPGSVVGLPFRGRFAKP